jgi:hypothetical protein
MRLIATISLSRATSMADLHTRSLLAVRRAAGRRRALARHECERADCASMHRRTYTTTPHEPFPKNLHTLYRFGSDHISPHTFTYMPRSA